MQMQNRSVWQKADWAIAWWNVDRWLLAVLGLAAALLLMDLGGRSLWWDEIVNVYIEQLPVDSIFASLNNTPGFLQDIHPPLYHLLMHFWIKVAGTSDLAMRLPSALLGIFLVGFVYAVGRQLGGRNLGRVAAFLTAISPGGLMYLRMGRYYALTAALAVLSTWLFLKLWDSPRRGLWLAYGLVALAMYYTDYLVVCVLATHTLFALWQGWRSRRTVALSLLGLQVLVALAYIPWIPFILAQIGWHSKLVHADLAFSPLGYLLKLLFPLISFTAGETLFPWEIPAILSYACFGVLLILGLARSPLKPAHALFLLLLVLIPLLGTVAVISFVMPTLPFLGVPNRMLFALPFLNLLAGCGWLALAKRWRQAIAIALITLVAAWGTLNYYRGVNFFNPIYAVSAEEIVDFVLANARPGDVVLSEGDIGFAYYLAGRNSDLINYGSHSPEADQVLEQATTPRVWWITFGRDRSRQEEGEKLYRSLLADGGYGLVLQRGFVPQDATYRWVKERLLGREAYEYKATVSLYTLQRQ